MLGPAAPTASYYEVTGDSIYEQPLSVCLSQKAYNGFDFGKRKPRDVGLALHVSVERLLGDEVFN